MKLGLGSALGALRDCWRAAAPASGQETGSPDHEFLISDPRRLRRLLYGLSGGRRLLSLLGQDGGYAAHALLRLEGMDSPRLTLELLHGIGAPQCVVNVTTAGERGLVMFTLEQFETTAAGLISAAWPRHVLSMQSRRHYRVVGLKGAGHRAELALVGALAATAPLFSLRDISEEGVSFELTQGQVLPDQARLDGACLHLDGQTLMVPWLEIVHRRSNGSSVAVIGARLLGMSADDLRRLRRWITERQAAGVALADAVAA